VALGACQRLRFPILLDSKGNQQEGAKMEKSEKEKWIEKMIQEENEMEMSAAFGKGVKVINAVTGQKWVTK